MRQILPRFIARNLKFRDFKTHEKWWALKYAFSTKHDSTKHNFSKNSYPDLENKLCQGTRTTTEGNHFLELCLRKWNHQGTGTHLLLWSDSQHCSIWLNMVGLLISQFSPIHRGLPEKKCCRLSFCTTGPDTWRIRLLLAAAVGIWVRSDRNLFVFKVKCLNSPPAKANDSSIPRAYLFSQLKTLEEKLSL